MRNDAGLTVLRYGLVTIMPLRQVLILLSYTSVLETRRKKVELDALVLRQCESVHAKFMSGGFYETNNFRFCRVLGLGKCRQRLRVAA